MRKITAATQDRPTCCTHEWPAPPAGGGGGQTAAVCRVQFTRQQHINLSLPGLFTPAPTRTHAYCSAYGWWQIKQGAHLGCWPTQRVNRYSEHDVQQIAPVHRLQSKRSVCTPVVEHIAETRTCRLGRRAGSSNFGRHGGSEIPLTPVGGIPIGVETREITRIDGAAPRGSTLTVKLGNTYALAQSYWGQRDVISYVRHARHARDLVMLHTAGYAALVRRELHAPRCVTYPFYRSIQGCVSGRHGGLARDPWSSDVPISSHNPTRERSLHRWFSVTLSIW